jgi:fatty-acyl-CoA synthase
MDPSVDQRRAAIERRHPAWPETTLDQYVRDAANHFGKRDLVVTDAATLSYRDTLEQADLIQAGLQAQGIAPGDRVGIVLANFPVVVPLLFAIWRAGAVAVPINTLNRPDEMAFAVRQSACRLVITMGAYFGRDYLADFDAMEAGWRAGVFTALPELRGIFVHGAPPDDPYNFDRLIASGSGQALPDVSLAAPHAPAVIMYTSGTTGSPKGVVQTHDNLLRAAYAGAYHQAFDDGRRAIFSLPLYHSFGLVVGLLSGIVVGGAIIPLTRFNAPAMLEAIGRHRATYLMGVPTMTVAMLEQIKLQHYDLSSLTAIHSAAAPTPSWVWRDIQQGFGCREIFTSYGQTETTATIVCTQPGDPIEIVSRTQGTIVLGGVAGIASQGGQIAEFKTIDPETAEDLPHGVAGELCTRGPLNAQGYFRRPEETAKIMLPGGWLRTGDLGQFLPDGNLLLTGRSKDLYKSRGELISPKEIELVLTGHPAISQAFVVGVPDEKLGECGAAWVVLSGTAPLTEAEVIGYLRSRIAVYKLPRDVWFIAAEDLPKTGTGKVQKSRLPELARRQSRLFAEAAQ